MTAVRQPLNKLEIKKSQGNLSDVINLILETDANESDYKAVESYAKANFTKDRAGLKKIYETVMARVNYVIDPSGWQHIKTPAWTFHNGKKGADCKSMTLLVNAFLRGIGVDYEIVFAWYDKKTPNSGHVYSAAFIDGERIVMDTVLGKAGGKFGEEKMPIWKTQKHKIVTKVAKISGFNASNAKDFKLPLHQMSDGELNLNLIRRQLEILRDLNETTAYDNDIFAIDSALNQVRIGVLGNLGNPSELILNRINRAKTRTKRPAIGEWVDKTGNIAGLGYNAYKGICSNYYNWKDYRHLLKFKLFISEKAEKEALQKYVDLDVRKCAEDKFKAEIINEYLEDSGPTMMYAVSQADTLSNRALIKKVGQGLQRNDLAFYTGLSHENANLYIVNGTLKNSTKQIPEIIEFAKSRYNTQVGLDPATWAIILSAVGAAFSVAGKMLAELPADPDKGAEIAKRLPNLEEIAPNLNDDFSPLDNSSSGSGNGTTEFITEYKTPILVGAGVLAVGTAAAFLI